MTWRQVPRPSLRRVTTAGHALGVADAEQDRRAMPLRFLMPMYAETARARGALNKRCTRPAPAGEGACSFRVACFVPCALWSQSSDAQRRNGKFILGPLTLNTLRKASPEISLWGIPA